MSEWLNMTAADLGRAIEAGEIGPVELTDAYLAVIDNHPERDRIYSAVTEERARAEAKAAEARAISKDRLSLLDGVPISWKDLFDSADTVTEAGCKLLEGRVPDNDALVLRNATEAGLICLGITQMS